MRCLAWSTERLLAKAQGGAHGALEASLRELHNVRVLHVRPGTLGLAPLSRFVQLRALTLCRVFGNRDDPAVAVALRQLPTSLQVRRTTGDAEWVSYAVLLRCWPSVVQA